MMCSLTGLEVSNASLYDGPTALVEAVHMATAATGRRRILVSGAVDPRCVETLRTYGAGEGFETELFGSADDRAAPAVGQDVAAVVVQHPNYFGGLEPSGLEELGRQCHAKAQYAAERLTDLDGLELLFPEAQFFKEVTLRLPRRALDVQASLIEAGYLVGPTVGEDGVLVAVTERR